MPAPGWKKKTKSPSGVGLTLVNLRRASENSNARGEHPAEKDVGLQSILESKDLDDVMERAELAGHVFSNNNPQLTIVGEAEGHQMQNNFRTTEMHRIGDNFEATSRPGLTRQISSSSVEAGEEEEEREEKGLIRDGNGRPRLTLPRRPEWTPDMTAKQLEIAERTSFLSWRKELAQLEGGDDSILLTPFEKNLDVWRQLWRVLERSDMVVLVVDARNPLFYRCPDLEAYVRELDGNKDFMLLLNKADLVTIPARKEWAAYFESLGLPFIFWSATAASSEVASDVRADVNDKADTNAIDNVRVLGREELLHRLSEHVRRASGRRNIKNDGEGVPLLAGGKAGLNTPEPVVVGFVGYPNVGKSSTINALVGDKKTGVTSTPGKTKHFQTLRISDELTLCDCPGLVFPSLSSSKSEMVAAGVVPIDKLTDYRGPVQFVADHVPRATLEAIYGISLPMPAPFENQSRSPTAAELLFVFAVSRGYFSNGGLPDETRVARLILKDYVSGKIPHCYLPPNRPDMAALSIDTRDLEPYSRDPRGRGLSLEDVSEEERLVEIGREDDGGASASGKISLEEPRKIASEDVKSEERATKLLGVVDHGGKNLDHVLTDLDDAVGRDVSRNKGQKNNGAPHKMHKKAPRRKDRTWRVGRMQSRVPTAINGVRIPISYGASDRHQLPIIQ